MSRIEFAVVQNRPRKKLTRLRDLLSVFLCENENAQMELMGKVLGWMKEDPRGRLAVP
jgi:hypothetical protein